MARCLLGHQRRQHERFLRRRSPVECARVGEHRVRQLFRARTRRAWRLNAQTNCIAETGEQQGRQHLGRDIFSGAQFGNWSAKFYRVFKAKNSSTGPRVRIPLAPPTSLLLPEKFRYAELSWKIRRLAWPKSPQGTRREVWRLLTPFGAQFSVSQFGGPVSSGAEHSVSRWCERRTIAIIAAHSNSWDMN